MSTALSERIQGDAAAPALTPRSEKIRRVTDPLLFAFIFVFGWQAFVWIADFHPVVLPPPSRVFDILRNQGDFLIENMLETMTTIVWGFVIGGLFGFVAGVLINHFEPVRRAIYPILVSLYVIPKAVFIPLFILWWGVGSAYKIVVTVLLAFFPVTENTITGLQGVDREMMELTQSLGGNRWFAFRKVGLPFALPFILAGLRIGLTESFIGGVLSEILVPTSTGIGSRIVEAAAFSNTEFIIAAILVVASFGIVSYFAFLWLEKKLTFWQ
jgi:NitT/TauT family transport system permease protein